MIRRLVEASVDHARWVVGLTLAIAALATFTATGLELDALPDLTNNQVLVLAKAPGLTPEELERLVVRPIEVASGGAPGLLETRSLSRAGVGAVTLVFADDVPVYLARQLVTERLANLTLPPSVDSVELGPVTGGLGEVFHFTVASQARSGAELLELVQLRVAPLLKGVTGVVEVNSWGGAERVFEVTADPVRLAQHDLTLSDLRAALRDATGTTSGAAMPSASGQVLLRGVSMPSTPESLAAAIVKPPKEGSRVLRVSDVAEVQVGQRVRLGAASRNGTGEVVYVMVQMLRGANALELTTRLHEVMPSVRAALPPDVALDVVYDRSVLVEGTLRTVAKNLVEGGVLVILVLLLMLGSVRAGLLVALSIPLSMVSATALMRLLGIPGNLMSLGAIDFGLLVDGSVVMVEGLFHALSHEHGHTALSKEGLHVTLRQTVGRLANPVFFSVLIILLVYVPVLTLSGTDGKLFRPMALTVVFALANSLVLALTFIPAAASLVLRPRDVPQRAPWLVRLVERAYPVVLRQALRRRGAIALSGVGLVCLGLGLVRVLGTEFTPQLNEGDLVIQTTRAPDSSIATSVAEAQHLERVLVAAVPEVRQVVSRVGSPAVATDIMGLEQADVFVSLNPRQTWRPGLTLDALIAQMAAALRRDAPGGEPSFTQPIQMRFNELLGGAVADVVVSLTGDDLGQLAKSAAQLRELVATVPGAQDVKVLAPANVPLSTVRPRALDAAMVGLTAADVLLSVHALKQGEEVGATWLGLVRVPILLRATSAPDVSDALVPTSGFGVVALSRVSDVETAVTPAQVNRRNGERRLMVGFNVRGADLGTVVEQARALVVSQHLEQPGLRIEWGGQYESLQAAARRLAIVIPFVLLLIVVVLLFAFRHFTPVAIIFSHVPFAAVGGVVALWVRSMPVSLSAAIGFIALAGIAVLNGVVMLSRIGELEFEGATSEAAASQAALQRARPVLMTALVAMLGFVPMMLATGPGAEVQRPLATVVVGGLASSTFLTLVVLPSLYPLFVRRKRRLTSR